MNGIPTTAAPKTAPENPLQHTAGAGDYKMKIGDSYTFKRKGHKHDGESVLVTSIHRDQLRVATFSNVVCASFGPVAGNKPKLKTWICKADELI